VIDHMELTQETVGMIQDRLNELARIYEEILCKKYVFYTVDAQVREIHALRSSLDDLYDELGKRGACILTPENIGSEDDCTTHNHEDAR
jgi:hypothetical protein